MRWCIFSRRRRRLFCGQDEGHDEAVEPQHLGEDQNEDHAHEEPGLLSGAPHTGVAHDADGEPGRQAAQAHAQAGAKVQEAPVGEETKGFIHTWPSDGTLQGGGSNREGAQMAAREKYSARLVCSQPRKNFRGGLMAKNMSVWKYFKEELSWKQTSREKNMRWNPADGKEVLQCID